MSGNGQHLTSQFAWKRGGGARRADWLFVRGVVDEHLMVPHVLFCLLLVEEDVKCLELG